MTAIFDQEGLDESLGALAFDLQRWLNVRVGMSGVTVTWADPAQVGRLLSASEADRLRAALADDRAMTPHIERFLSPHEADRPMIQREADRVREALSNDPTVSHDEFGKLVEEADEADERASWAAESDQ